MAARTVKWTDTASFQLRKVLEFWVENNKTNIYSLKLLDQVETNLNGILKHPERSPESVYPGVRVAAMTHYSIFYRITEEAILVMAFWDNRQDPKRLYTLLKAGRNS